MNINDIIPTVERKQKKKSTYRKPESIKKLERDYKAWHYSRVKCEEAHQVDFKFSDKSANELTKAVCSWFKCHGGKADRINTTGTYSVKLKRFIKSGVTRGTADIDATIRGINIKIEVKFGRDVMSEHQKKYMNEIIAAGGRYIVVKTFDGFINQIYGLIQ